MFRALENDAYYYSFITEDVLDKTQYEILKPGAIWPQVSVFPKYDMFHNLTDRAVSIVKFKTTSESKVMETANNGRSIVATDMELVETNSLTPSYMQSVLLNDGLSPMDNNGMILMWSVEQEMKSMIIFLLKNYPSLKIYMDHIVNAYITRAKYNSVMELLIERFGYDISKDNYRMLQLVAFRKDADFTEYLLEKGSMIPRSVYSAFNVNKRKFKEMWRLINRYADRITPPLEA